MEVKNIILSNFDSHVTYFTTNVLQAYAIPRLDYRLQYVTESFYNVKHIKCIKSRTSDTVLCEIPRDKLCQLLEKSCNTLVKVPASRARQEVTGSNLTEVNFSNLKLDTETVS